MERKEAAYTELSDFPTNDILLPSFISESPLPEFIAVLMHIFFVFAIILPYYEILLLRLSSLSISFCFHHRLLKMFCKIVSKNPQCPSPAIFHPLHVVPLRSLFVIKPNRRRYYVRDKFAVMTENENMQYFAGFILLFFLNVYGRICCRNFVCVHLLFCSRIPDEHFVCFD